MLAPGVGYGTSACPPIDPCCCDAWSIAPGDILPLQIYFGDTLAESPGFRINSVVSCELIDLNAGPPGVPADPDEIAVVSGYDTDPSPPPQPGFAKIVNESIVEVLIACDASTAIGRAYRLNLCVRIRD